LEFNDQTHPSVAYLHGKIPQYKFNKRLGGPIGAQGRFRAFGEEIPLVIVRNRTKIPLMSKSV